MANQLDIIIKYILDKSAAAGVEQGTNKVASDLGDVNKVVKALDATFDELEKKMKEATSIKEFESLERQLKEVEGEAKAVTKSFQLQARVLRAEAGATVDDVAKAQIAQIKALNDQLGQISALGLGLGLGISGGIFAGAAKYVKDAKEATDVTRQWEAAQRSLEESGQRVGATLAGQVLPGLQQAAQLAGTASRFVEQHPEVVRAALKFGEVTIALSAVGLLVNKGIKLYTDVQTLLFGSEQIAAARLQDLAANKQLAAARLQAGLNGVETPQLPGGVGAGGSFGKIAGTIALTATSVIIGSELGTILGNKIGEAITDGRTGLAGKGNFGVGDAVVGTGMLFQTPAFLALKGLNELGVVSDKTVEKFRENVTALDRFAAGLLGANKILNVIKNTASDGAERGGRAPTIDSGTTRVSTETLQQALRIYEDYRDADLKLVQDHYADRDRIISGALQAEQAENAQYAASVSKARAQTASSLIKAAADFARANEQAEIQNNQRRAQIVRDGGEEVERIEAQLQERLRKLNQDHADRTADLIAARDALGLVKEQRRYDREHDEEIRNTNQEIAQRRRDIAQRLDDLQQSYVQERDQRLADYEARVAEIKAEGAQRLTELAQQHQAEIRKIQEQKVARLRELDNQFVEERKRRYNQFLQQLRDLDAGLLGEKKLREAYQARMLQDLETFLNTYRARLATLGGTGTTGGTTGSRAFGGYATYGNYLLGDRPGGGPGDREYVIPGDTTRMLERLIGGQITPERLMSAAIYGGGGGTRSTVYNDNRRIASQVSSTDRERMRQDMMSALAEVLQ